MIGCTINDIAYNGRPKIFKMHTELMSATSGWLEFYQGVFIVLLYYFVVSLRGFAILVNLESGRALEVARNREVDHGFGEFGMTFNDSVVSFVGFAILKLLAEHFLRGWVFGKNYDAASITVKTVYK